MRRQSEDAMEPIGTPNQDGVGDSPTGTGGEHRDGWESGIKPCAWGLAVPSLSSFPLPLEEACAGSAAPGAGPQIPAGHPAASTPYRGSPDYPKRVYQGAAALFTGLRAATFFTTLPHHLRSPVISASNPPPSDRTGSTGRMGRVPAAQLWALLSPLRRLAGIFQNGQKAPSP